jgi:dihydropyrimidine dehydrogenase (NAD+) subunit PreA
VNLKEMYEVKKKYPKHTIIASLMVETKENWKEIIKKAEDTGCDGLELNFGCPHGMCERGMGSAVGQEPKVLEEITRWAMEYAKTPVIIKLTPNTLQLSRVLHSTIRVIRKRLSGICRCRRTTQSLRGR